MAQKKKIPTFRRPNYGRTKRSRIKANWRRPRGIDNKMAFKKKYMGKRPSIGYRQDKTIRGQHPRAAPETLVNNVSEIESVKAPSLVRIAGSVGARLKKTLVEKAKALKLHVLNP